VDEIFHLDSYEIEVDGRWQSDGNFLFVKIGLSSIKNTNSIIFFGNHEISTIY
jgi:hypothetical protein